MRKTVNRKIGEVIQEKFFSFQPTYRIYEEGTSLVGETSHQDLYKHWKKGNLIVERKHRHRHQDGYYFWYLKYKVQPRRSTGSFFSRYLSREESTTYDIFDVKGNLPCFSEGTAQNNVENEPVGYMNEDEIGFPESATDKSKSLLMACHVFLIPTSNLESYEDEDGRNPSSRDESERNSTDNFTDARVLDPESTNLVGSSILTDQYQAIPSSESLSPTSC